MVQFDMPFALLRSATLSVLSTMLAVGQALPHLQRPVAGAYHGVKITDNYRWLKETSVPKSRPGALPKTATRGLFWTPNPREPSFRPTHETVWWFILFIFGIALRYRSGVLFALKSQPPKETAIAGLDDVGERSGRGEGQQFFYQHPPAARTPTPTGEQRTSSSSNQYPTN